MFQPIRPPVKWSSVEKRFARRKGGSKEVEAVIPKARFLVTAAMALMGYDTSGISMKASLSFRKSTYDRRVCHRPLRCPSDAVIQTPFIRIVSAVCIREEQSIDISSFENFGKVNPVLQTSLFCRAVFGILSRISTLIRKLALKESPSIVRGLDGQRWTCQMH